MREIRAWTCCQKGLILINITWLKSLDFKNEWNHESIIKILRNAYMCIWRERKKEQEPPPKWGVAWWLGRQAFTAMTQVHSLVRELRPCKPRGTGTKLRYIYVCMYMWDFSVTLNHSRKDSYLRNNSKNLHGSNHPKAKSGGYKPGNSVYSSDCKGLVTFI